MARIRALSLVFTLLPVTATALPSGSEAPSPAAASKAWPQGVFRWHYNPQHHPSWLDAPTAAAIVQDAAKKWEACGIRIEYLGETTLQPGAADGQNVVGWVPELPRGVRALTQGTGKGDQLLERDITIAAERQEFKRFPRLLEKVITHEFGHAIGLTHSTVCTDVMTLAADCPGMPVALLPVIPTDNDLKRCRRLYDDVRR